MASGKSKKKLNWEEALEEESWVSPLSDIYETENSYVLLAQMPGVAKNNIKIKLEEEYLVVMGRIDYDEALSRKYVLKETDTSNYYRRYKIASNVNEQEIDADIENGQLYVKLPKREVLKAKNLKEK